MSDDSGDQLIHIGSVEITQVTGTQSDVSYGDINSKIVSQSQLVMKGAKMDRPPVVTQRENLVIGMAILR